MSTEPILAQKRKRTAPAMMILCTIGLGVIWNTVAVIQYNSSSSSQRNFMLYIRDDEQFILVDQNYATNRAEYWLREPAKPDVKIPREDQRKMNFLPRLSSLTRFTETPREQFYQHSPLITCWRVNMGINARNDLYPDDAWYAVRENPNDPTAIWFAKYNLRTRELITYCNKDGLTLQMPNNDEAFRLLAGEFVDINSYNSFALVGDRNFNKIPLDSSIYTSTPTDPESLTLVTVEGKASNLKLSTGEEKLLTAEPVTSMCFSVYSRLPDENAWYHCLRTESEILIVDLADNQIVHRVKIPTEFANASFDFSFDPNGTAWYETITPDGTTMENVHRLTKANFQGEVIKSIDDLYRTPAIGMNDLQGGNLPLMAFMAGPPDLFFVIERFVSFGSRFFQTSRYNALKQLYPDLWMAYVCCMASIVLSLGIYILRQNWLGMQILWWHIILIITATWPAIIVIHFLDRPSPQFENKPSSLGTEIFA